MEFLHFNEDTRVKFPATAHFLRLAYALWQNQKI